MFQNNFHFDISVSGDTKLFGRKILPNHKQSITITFNKVMWSIIFVLLSLFTLRSHSLHICYYFYTSLNRFFSHLNVQCFVGFLFFKFTDGQNITWNSLYTNWYPGILPLTSVINPGLHKICMWFSFISNYTFMISPLHNSLFKPLENQECNTEILQIWCL